MLQYLEWAGGLVAFATAVVVGINKVKEAKARKQGLDGNPKRCMNHEERLANVEGDVKAVRATLTGIEDRLELVQTDVKTLLNLHLEK